MASPLEAAAARIRAEQSAPAETAWVRRRTMGLAQHYPSFENLAAAVGKFVTLLGDSNRWTADVFVQHGANAQTQDSDTFWHTVINVVPRQRPLRNDSPIPYAQNGPIALDSGAGWHPNVALQVVADMVNPWDYSDKVKGRRPSDQVYMRYSLRSWGDRSAASHGIPLPSGAQVYTRDQGWERLGTAVLGTLEGEQSLGVDEAECLLAVLADNVAHHHDIVRGTYQVK